MKKSIFSLIDEAKYMEHFFLLITLKYLNGPSNTETNRLTSGKWPSVNMPQTLQIQTVRISSHVDALNN